MLADDVRALSDGGGEFHAALRPIVGRDKVTRFFAGLTERAGAPERIDSVMVNGMPAVMLTFAAATARYAPQAIVQVRVGADGRVSEVYVVLATRKLAALGRAR